MNRYVKDIEIKCENDSLFFPKKKGDVIILCILKYNKVSPTLKESIKESQWNQQSRFKKKPWNLKKPLNPRS